MHADPVAVAGDDAAGLLAPVLQGVEAEVGEPGRVGVPVDAEDAAVLPGFVNAVVSPGLRLPILDFR